MFTKKPEPPRETVAPSRPTETVVLRPTPPSPATPPRPAEQGRGMGNMVPSIIGEDLTVTGNIISKGEVQIEGEVQGDIHCSSLVVGEKAQVTGGLVAEDVVVRGRVVGSIRGSRVTLQSSSHVEGDIYHQSLAIEQGAFFEGKSRRSDSPTAQKPEASATAKSSSPPASSADKTQKSDEGAESQKPQRAAE